MYVPLFIMPICCNEKIRCPRHGWECSHLSMQRSMSSPLVVNGNGRCSWRHHRSYPISWTQSFYTTANWRRRPSLSHTRTTLSVCLSVGMCWVIWSRWASLVRREYCATGSRVWRTSLQALVRGCLHLQLKHACNKIRAGLRTVGLSINSFSLFIAHAVTCAIARETPPSHTH